MAGVAKIFMVVVMCLGAAGMVRTPCAASESPGLLEQSKQLIADKTDPSDLWIEDKTGQFLPLDLEFVDEEGKTVRLGDIIDRPTLFLPIYFYCPNICSKNLANLAIALNNLSFQPGRDFRVIALSFNDAETTQDAARAKRNYLKILDKDFPSDEWRFLTGRQEAIKAATEAVGFRFEKVDDETFIHPAALMAIAADGKISRYIFGSFLAGDIDVALSAAASGTTALAVRRLLDFCFNYDPRKNISVFQTVKIVVLLLFAVTLGGLWLYYRRKGLRAKAEPPDNSITQD